MSSRIQSSSENAADFAWQHDDVFGRIASRYDLLCDVFSFGMHRLWKRRMAQCIASETWSVLLDGATGTGDIVLRLLAHESTDGRTVIASDISTKMLAVARQRLASRAGRVRLTQLDAEAMSTIDDGSVDAYSMSLGLKICNRHLAIAEAFRVLRPGGRLILLEASNIPWWPLQRAYLAYMAVCMPVLGWLASGGDASAYRYLLHGIREFPSAEGLAAEIAAHGFEDVTFERLSLGIVAIHSARKPGWDFHSRQSWTRESRQREYGRCTRRCAMTPHDHIEKQILLHAPRERVWQAISESGRFGHWFGVEFDEDFAAGRHITGTIVSTRVDSEIARMQEPYRGTAFDFDIERVEPMKLFSFRWHPGATDPATDYSREPTTLVEFELKDAPDGTLLTITESGFDQLPSKRRDQAYASNEGGWQAQTQLISKYLTQTNPAQGGASG